MEYSGTTARGSVKRIGILQCANPFDSGKHFERTAELNAAFLQHLRRGGGIFSGGVLWEGSALLINSPNRRGTAGKLRQL
jgi:hypothetical protein